jgi:nitroimidazol reductase NimA-like FMN-containing flavoprotein (pyridoxamine 5'-phosphate oxidase superfamily)
MRDDSTIRKKERAVLDKDCLLSALDACPYGILAVASAGKPYAVPLSFARRDNSIYFHSAIVGRKLDYLAASATVSFLAIPHSMYISGKLDFEYFSIYAEGLARIVTDTEEKTKAYRLIMAKYEGDPNFRELSSACLDASVIVCIDICRITGKEHTAITQIHPQVL